MKLRLVTLVAALGALGISLIPLFSIINSVSIRKHGIATECTVIDRSHSRRGLPSVKVSFNTSDGKEVIATASIRHAVTSGVKIKVWYDPSMPQRIDFGDTTGYNLRGLIIAGLISLFCFYYFIRYTITDSKNSRLVKKGMKVAAGIVGVERNTRYGMGPNDPWVIKCKWTDDSQNREYYYFSKDYIIDPSQYIEGRLYVDVYIDRDDPAKYYMDTSFMPKGNITIG
jgi:hypothetical protein